MQADQGKGPGFFTRVWRSIIRGPVIPRDDGDRKWIVFNTLILHFRPLRVPVRTIRYTHTFGLGGMSLVLFLLLAATGSSAWCGTAPGRRLRRNVWAASTPSTWCTGCASRRSMAAAS